MTPDRGDRPRPGHPGRQRAARRSGTACSPAARGSRRSSRSIPSRSRRTWGPRSAASIPRPRCGRSIPPRLGRASQLAIAAARMALEDAGIEPERRRSRAGGRRHGHHLRRAAGGRALRRPRPGRRARPGRPRVHLPLSLPHDRRPRRPRAGLRRGQHDDPDRLRGRQLRHRPRLRRAARRPGRRHARRRRRRLLAHHLHRLLAAWAPSRPSAASRSTATARG